MENEINGKILIGNSFPLALIRRDVEIHVKTLGEAKDILKDTQHFSFWGHENTMEAAGLALGCDLTPKTTRPALALDGEGFPMLDGVSFTSCLVCSPEYRAGYRPAIGEEVPSDAILGWSALLIDWTPHF